MTNHQKRIPKVKLGCDYCGIETTGRVDTCDGGTAICCRECKKELRHDHDTETGECLL